MAKRAGLVTLEHLQKVIQSMTRDYDIPLMTQITDAVVIHSSDNASWPMGSVVFELRHPDGRYATFSISPEKLNEKLN